MKKIKGQGKVTKFIASKIAKYNKNSFTSLFSSGKNMAGLIAEIANKNKFIVTIVSFSSSHDFAEQILSILSFVRYVGNPNLWIVYSDGTHNKEQIFFAESTFSFLKIVVVEFDELYVNSCIKNSLLPYKKYFIDYANTFPLGKKLFFYLNFPIDNPTIFLDSDVLFYAKSLDIINIIKEDYSGWFLPDSEWGNLDSRYIASNNPQHYQVNSGLFILNKELTDLSDGLDFLKILNGKYEYFSEQNIIHIILSSNKLMPLDPRIFILNSSDQFDFSYLYAGENIAIRHYTGPVRHKMWQKNWRWHLSI